MRAPRLRVFEFFDHEDTAPSPITNPSRPTSKGREARWGSALRVLIAFMAQKPPMPRGTIVASDAAGEA
jgi:hypothetical protein